MIPRESKSYPFLAIAQHRGVPYEKVLHYADYVRVIEFGGRMPDHAEFLNQHMAEEWLSVSTMAEIRNAVVVQEWIRRGVLQPW
jgi:hypothetical protein